MAYVFPRPPKKKAASEAEGALPPKKKGRAKKPIQMMGFTDRHGDPKQKSSRLRDPVAALAKAQQLEQEERDVKDGVRPVITGRGVRLKEIAEAYMEAGLGTLESAYMVKGRIRNHLIPVFGDRLASSILPMELDKHFAQLLKDGLSNSSVRQVRSHMSMIYKYAIRGARMSDLDNPVKDANGIRRIKRKPTPIPLSWIEPLLANVSRHYYPLFVTALFTGLRKGELAGLRLCDVNFETRMVHVTRSFKKESTKSGKERPVGINVRLVPLLQNHVTERRRAGVGDEGPLFTVEDLGQRDPGRTARKTPLKAPADWSIHHEVDLPYIMRSALKAAGIVDGFEYTCRKGKSRGRKGTSPAVTWGCGQQLRKQVQEETLCVPCERRMWCEPIPVKRAFKDLRSTFGTWLARTSGSIRAASVLLGHSAVKVTEDSYALLEATDLLEEIDNLPFALVERKDMQKVGNGTQGSPSAPYAFLTPEASERPASPSRAAQGPVIPDTYDMRAVGIEPTTYGLRVQGELSYSGNTGMAGSGRGQHQAAGRAAKPRGCGEERSHHVAAGSSPRRPPTYAFLTPTRPNLTVLAGGGERLLTPEQVAAALGVCRDSVYRLIKRGELNVSRFGTAVIRIRASDLEAFLQRSSSPTPKGSP